MPVIHSERDPSRAEENPPPVASFSADSSPCTVGGIMFFNSLTQVGSHTHIVASVGAFQDIAGPALRLAHQGFARSGHSAQGGMAERVGFEPTSPVLPGYPLSRRALSTAQTPLRG